MLSDDRALVPVARRVGEEVPGAARRTADRARVSAGRRVGEEVPGAARRTARPYRAVSYARPRLLVPEEARVLRARAVTLRPGAAVEWHTTGEREELLVAVGGSVDVEAQDDWPAGRRGLRLRRVRLKAGSCLFLPQGTRHRVVNRSPRLARYLYVTAPR